jgi:hypothetical protein
MYILTSYCPIPNNTRPQLRGQSTSRLSAVLAGVGASSFRFTRAGTANLSSASAAGTGSIDAASASGGARILGGSTVRSGQARWPGWQAILAPIIASDFNQRAL